MHYSHVSVSICTQSFAFQLLACISENNTHTQRHVWTLRQQGPGNAGRAHLALGQLWAGAGAVQKVPPHSAAGTSPPSASTGPYPAPAADALGSGEYGMRLCRTRVSGGMSLGLSAEISAPKVGPSDAETSRHTAISLVLHRGEVTAATELGRES